MALSVIGAGFGRTGTLSLKGALETLGFNKCYHMIEVFSEPNHSPQWLAAAQGKPVNWEQLLDGYAASVDWPACYFYKELAEQYPEAKVILSVRDPEAWFKSASNTIFPMIASPVSGDDEIHRNQQIMAKEVILKQTFGGDLQNKDRAIEIYKQHIEEVKRTIPAERLLEFEAKQGWGPLCEFLGQPIPDEPYPRVNTSEEFAQRKP